MINEPSDIFKKAKQNVSGSSSFTFTIAKIIISPKRIGYFYCWYAYFRWVDDFADSNNRPLFEKVQFINYQINLIEKSYSEGLSIDSFKEEELFLYHLMLFDNENGKTLKEFIIQMLRCIQFDIKRAGSYTESKELEYFFNLEVLSYLNTFHFFCGPTKYYKIQNSKEGNAGKWVHIIRDFIKDIDDQIYNLPKDDILKYNLHSLEKKDLLNSIAFKEWIINKLQDAHKNFITGKQEVKAHPSLKYKILVIILCSKYELYLKAIKADNYNLKRDYKIKKLFALKTLPSILIQLTSISIQHIFYYRQKQY